MTTDLDRRRLAAAAELERFEADERRRLAYADRAETLEVRDEEHDPGGHCRDRNCDYEVGGRWSCEYPPICTPPLADGTGRHSRKEMEQAQHCTSPRSHNGFPTPCGQCDYCRADAERDRLAMEGPRGVSFTSVPQLCAAYEYALETMRSLYLLLDLKQHAWQPEQEVMREARRLLLAAGKDVE